MSLTFRQNTAIVNEKLRNTRCTFAIRANDRIILRYYEIKSKIYEFTMLPLYLEIPRESMFSQV